MRTLVTGATGFIGQRLVRALCEAGTPVKILSRRDTATELRDLCPGGDVVSMIADLTETKSLARICEGVDTVLHLAGYAHADDASAAMIHRAVTVDGTKALLAAAARAGVARFVFVSSVKAMGEGSAECLNEDAFTQPTTVYGRAKLEAEQLVLAAGRDCRMHVAVLRLPLVYGAGHKGNIPRMLAAIDRGWFLPLPDTYNKRSMVWVDDAVQAILVVARRSEANGKTYIVTDGQEYSTRRIYTAIYAALQKPIPRWWVPLPLLKALGGIGDAIGRLRHRHFMFDSLALEKLVGSACYDGRKIQQELGYRPRAQLETVLPEIVAHYRQRGGRRESL